MSASTSSKDNRVNQQPDKVRVKVHDKYPNVIQIVVVPSTIEPHQSHHENYDMGYLTSTDRISPLWQIG